MRAIMCALAASVIMSVGCRPNDVESSSAPLPLPRRSATRTLPPLDVTVHILPMGNMPKQECDRLARELKTRVPVKFDVIPAMPVPVDALNSSRRQFEAAQLLVDIMGKYSKYDGDRKSFVLAITTEDIYSKSDNFRYIFATGLANFMLVSIARMDPLAYGLPMNPDLLRTRMRKMALKRIGSTVYGMSNSDDIASVMYGPVGGPQDLDRMGEVFLTSDKPLVPEPGGGPKPIEHVFSEKEQEQARELIKRIDRGENPSFGGH